MNLYVGRSALQSGKGLRDLNGLLFVQQEILFPVGQKKLMRAHCFVHWPGKRGIFPRESAFPAEEK